MYPFERFTELAKKALALAQEEAEQHRSSYIGTEHLLLGLMRIENGTAWSVLDRLGIDADAVRKAIEPVLDHGKRHVVGRIIPSSRVKRAIEIAFEEARMLNQSRVSTGALLLGLIVEGEDEAARVLAVFGLNADEVREGVAEAPAEEGEPRVNPYPAEGARVLVHDGDPPYRLWEGRVLRVDAGMFLISIADRPAGTEVRATHRAIHAIPTGPTFGCPYCQAHL
jgi:ATP-dependent Clp protease ATP-binding subunit ClpA